jgi:hypothetical protein
MSRPGTTTGTAPARHARSKQHRTAPAHRKLRRPIRKVSTQGLLAQVWSTLEWHKTLQIGFIITITGVMATLTVAGLALLAHMISTTAALPVSITITWTVSYTAAHRRR